MKTTMLLCWFTLAVNAQEKITVTGHITDERGHGLAYVNVFFKDGDFAGDVSDDQGVFEIQTGRTGERTLVATLLGYETWERKVLLPSSERFAITLNETTIALNEIQVEASAYTGGEGKVTLSKIDVYTTPGGAADVFQSIKALPGITQSDETAGLPVRGGHPSETVVLLNHATLRHPYRSENVGGTGLFSVVETAAMKKLYFSSGGFSVKYGNALSGVLDIETEPRITKNRVQMDANFATGGGGIQHVLIEDKLNFQVYGKHTSTDLLYRINKPTVDIVEDPSSTAITGMANYTYSKTGLVQFLALQSSDDQVLDIPILSNRARYSLHTRLRVGSLMWSDFIGRNIMTRTSLSYSGYENDWGFAPWSKNNQDQNAKLRHDIQWDYSRDMSVSGGFEVSRDRYAFQHLLPKRRGEFFPGADSVQLDDDRHFNSVGGYIEIKKRLFHKTTAIAGIRQDYHGLANRSSIDVRGGIVHELSDQRFLRLGAGTFHQFPEALLYESSYSQTSLRAMQAKHLVAGFEERRDKFELRAEVYSKWYRDLPLENMNGLLTSDGNGYAYGADLFLKGRWKRTNGWISYSFIHTRRREMDVASVRPTSYDITHNVKLVQKTSLGKGYEISSTLRYATGRPITDITDASQASDGSWIPTYGPRFGDRLPDFVRLDVRMSRFFFFSDAKYLVLYIETLNVTDHHNLLDYSYSNDFKSRQGILSYFANRIVVAGFSLSL